ncbi:MAG: PAS domain S-box protein [Ignavibacteria bacterium]|jgi:PAS domain S-box-containing protein|nr:PAS domain S-box protein [Ignavibacteria bacterium]MCU7503534.1 PAS domain S-box protein [Ignavibacteria bacterium]MCU7517280.1 PAS domain S-box protein [Ignavibacteria bacterium]
MERKEIRILQIEDNPGDVRLIKEMLKDVRQGRLVLNHAADLASGIEFLNSNECDLVLLDLGLPDSTGLKTLERLHEAKRVVPVVIMTGLDDEELGFEAVKMGAQDYLVKGQIDSNILLRSIRYAIERKRIDEKLRRSEERFRSTFEQAAVGIAHVSTEGDWLRVNSKLCGILGYTSEKILTMNCIKMTHPDDLGRDQEKIDELLSYEIDTYTIEKRYMHKDGYYVWCQLTRSLVEESPEAPKYFLSVIEDITKRKQTELALENNAREMSELNRKLKELNASKDKFFSIVAHDLRSPFSALLGFSEYMHKHIEELTHDEIKDFSFRIYKSLNSLLKLIENLLQWARINTGKMEFSPDRFSLNELLDEILNIYNINAGRKNIKLYCSLDNSYEVYADKDMIDSVLRNLLSNAIKFTASGGEIRLAAKKRNGYVEVSVADTGIGIRKEDMERMFRIDENLTREGTENEKGTGLGLVLCREFVQMNGGTIEVESEHGKGSTFRFTIPEEAGKSEEAQKSLS